MRKLPVKVLHMAPLGAGGISKLTVTINGLINLNNVMFDYLVFKDEKTFYEDIVYKYGAKKQLVNVSKYQSKKLLLYWKKYTLTRQLLKKVHYDVVHVDASTPMDVVIGMAAKSAGVKRVIIHSHIAGDNKNSAVRKIYLDICRKKMLSTFDDYFAISDSAAEFMFPQEIVSKKKYTLIPNGIQTELYKYDSEMREEVRKKLEFDNKFVVGHVGRFSKEKNHKVLIKIFADICKLKENAVLLLIGEGILKKEIIEQVKNEGIEDRVVFYGTSHEVPKLMLAMDIFVFPSEFEGLGISAIEAQCSGLPTFCSLGIPECVGISPMFERIAGFNPEDWTRAILSRDYSIERHDYINEVISAGFDIKNVSKRMEKYYMTATQ